MAITEAFMADRQCDLFREDFKKAGYFLAQIIAEVYFIQTQGDKITWV
jgi:hypothetical protein